VRERIVNFNYISSGWLATMGTPLLAGRDFGSADRVGTGAKALVNQKFADKYFDGASPLGKIVRTADYPSRPGQSIEIVGLVGDAVYRDLREPLSPTMYFALAQDSAVGSTIVVTALTSTPEPRELTRALTAAVAGVHPDFSVSFRSLQEFVDGALTQERLIAMLSGFFGGLALLLAALGLYGITSYSVIRRRAELGIRLALGASPGALVRLVMSRTGALVLAGLVIGGVAAWWASRFVATLLFGLTPTDPVTIVGAMAVLAVVAALAGWLPARRAAVIDPAEVLREG
jgi:ABC-type antimicrobial peptide transport system permease subunit